MRECEVDHRNSLSLDRSTPPCSGVQRKGPAGRIDPRRSHTPKRVERVLEKDGWYCSGGIEGTELSGTIDRAVEKSHALAFPKISATRSRTTRRPVFGLGQRRT